MGRATLDTCPWTPPPQVAPCFSVLDNVVLTMMITEGRPWGSNRYQQEKWGPSGGS